MMYLIGKMRTKMKISLLVIVLFVFGCSNNDKIGIYPIGSTIPDEFKINKTLENVKTDGTYIPGSMEDKRVIQEEVSKSDNIDFSPLSETQDAYTNMKLDSIASNQGLPGDYDNAKNFLEYDDKALLKKAHNKGNTDFHFSYYISNDLKIKGRGGLYNSIFKGKNSKNYGPIMLGFHKFITKKFFEPFYGVNLGFQYGEGNGNFVSGGTSEATFKLWMIPVDAVFGFNMNLSRYVKVGLMGGPSVMGLLQSRTDFGEDEPLKRRRQVGVGYFAAGNAKISLSQIFTGYGFNLYRESDVTQLYLALDFRMVNYSSFQDDITIDGTATGVGFVFEFL